MIPISYWPHEISYEQANVLREKNPGQYIDYAYRSMYTHVQLMLQFMDKGAITFDYGNNIRARALEYEQKNEIEYRIGIEFHSPFTTHHSPLTSPVSFPPTFARFFAKAKVPFAGQH